MKNLHPLFILIPVILSACSSGDLEQSADFTFRNEDVSTWEMATYDTCSVINRTENVQSLRWDLGDGRSSENHIVVLSYDEAGTYDVTLSVVGIDGEEITVSKKVIVKDRVLRSIRISKIYWEENVNGWPPTPQADIYLQIQDYSNAEMTDGFLCTDCPLLFTSDVVADVERNTTTPIEIPVTEKFVVDKKKIRFANPENLNNAYLISLMAKDEDGNAYCLQSNRGSGTYFGILEDNFTANKFIVQNGPFSEYLLICEFE